MTKTLPKNSSASKGCAPGSRIRCSDADFIKLFADGVLEYPTQTAALLEPYNDAKGKPGKSTGKLYIAPADMKAFIAEAGNHGFNIHVHAIGDGAVHETLDAFAAARAAGSKQLFSIAHLQLIEATDIPRFAELDVYPSLQLLWAQPDNYSIDALTPWLGAERMARQYPARSLDDAGATVAGGSDWDVSSYNPFEAMATAMSRKNPEHPERAPLNSREAMTLDEMLAAYTINAARLMGREREIGSLGVGKFADLIVLDRRLTTQTGAADVRVTKPTLVVFNGRDVTPATATLVRLAPRFRPRAPVGAHQQVAREARKVPRHENDRLRVEGDDDLALAAQDAVHHDARRLLRLHAQPGRNRIPGMRMQATAVVHAPDVGVHESRRYQRAAHAQRKEIAVQRLREGAHRELAHGVG